MNFPEDLVRGSIAPVVLSLLAERPMYGYEMVKQVNARTKGILELKEGTLYPALHRMEAEGLLAASWKQAPDSARRRKYYRLAAKGRAQLARRRSEWSAFTTAVNQILTPS